MVFDEVDHCIFFLTHLNHQVGIQGTALKWFVLADRTSSVNIGRLSSSTPTTCGVPQKSTLGPMLVCLYMILSSTSTMYPFTVTLMTLNYIFH